MLLHGHKITLQWPRKSRIPWLLLSFASMLVSAYSVFGWMDAVGRISGWTGLPQYEAQIPQFQTQARICSRLAIALPFVAAWFLGLGKKEVADQIEASGTMPVSYPPDSRPWLAPVVRYAVRLAISILGTLGFTVGLFLVGLVLHKL